MIRIRIGLLAGFAAAAAVAAPQFEPSIHNQLQVPAFPRETRAAWVATVWNIDWPISKGTSQTTQNNQKNEALAILNHAADLKLNALYLQVRSQCEAMYQSSIEPWSNWLTNTMGTGPNPVWDPLAFWISEAHKRNIELHAWVNPYRAWVTGSTPANHITVSNPSIVRTYGTQKYLDPGEPATRAHVTNVIVDIVNRYDVDGIVFDDYFYPYPISGTPFPDDATYAVYGGGLSLSNWRRKNVDDFVQGCYSAVHAAKQHVQFGIGPFGIWKPGNPSGVTGLSAYDSLYADSRKWLQMGWVDYLAPQLYWKISSSGQPYDDLMAWWSNATQNPLGRHVYASNNASNLSTSGGWPAQEILDQIEVTRNTPGAKGNVHFSVEAITTVNYQSIRQALINGPYAVPALPPALTWLDNLPPVSPKVTYSFDKVNHRHVMGLVPQGSEAYKCYAAAFLVGSTWTYQVIAKTATSVTVNQKGPNGPLRAYGIASVDRCGNLSPWVTRVLDATVLTSPVQREGFIGPPPPAVSP